MQDAKTKKTFVAPLVGGTADGRLVRLSHGCDRFLQTVQHGIAIIYERYQLVTLADGSLVWQFEND